MANETVLTRDNFQMLLRWLDDDDEPAGKEYLKIRARLVKLFIGRGCHEPELLADLTIDRVISKLPTFSSGYSGEPGLYFYGVALKIHKEWLRGQKIEIAAKERPVSESDDADDDLREAELECLASCLASLPSNLRQMIVEYYHDGKSAKIERRRSLAKTLEISPAALRLKASRVRGRLFECVRKCVASKKK